MVISLSLILPCFNEEENIAYVVDQVMRWLEATGVESEVIVVDDGSTDGTYRVLQQLRSGYPSLRTVRHDHNCGYGLAVRTGLDAGTKQYLAFMDSDGQFLPSDFSLLLPHLQSVDFVAGYRKQRADPFMRSFNALVFGWLSKFLLGIRPQDINCGMKIFHRRLWPIIRPQYGFGGVFNAELYYRLRQHGISYAQVPVTHAPRRAGCQTGASLRVICRAFSELWKLRFMTPREQKESI